MRCLTIVAACLMAGSCAASGSPEPTAPPAAAEVLPARLEDRFPLQFGTYHYGLYLFGEKAGHMRWTCRRDPTTEEIHETVRMEVSSETEGVVTKSSYETSAIYTDKPPHALYFVDETTDENGALERAVFDASGPSGRFGIFAGGESNLREGLATSQSLESRLEGIYGAWRGPVGTRRQWIEFDMELQKDQTVEAEFLGLETVQLGEDEFELRHVRQTSSSGKGSVDLFVDSRGMPLAMRMGDVMELRLEDAERASANVAAVELFAKASVPLEGFKGNPERMRELELEWSGASQLLPERAGQSSRWKDETRVQLVTLKRLPRPSKAARRLAVPEEVRRELEHDSRCNSDHARIRAASAEIVGEVIDPWRRVELVVAWMQENIEGRLGSDHWTALAVLDSRQGDCTEFTVLASGLLRAAGVPTRRVNGVALVSDEPGRLLGHAWVEVWVGEWIPVDPTFGQAPADCGHVCFGGEKDIEFLGDSGMSARVASKR